MTKTKTPAPPALKLEDLNEAPFNPRNIGQDALDARTFFQSDEQIIERRNRRLKGRRLL